MTRTIALVVKRTTHAEQAREQRRYWAARTVAERLAEVEALRRLWIAQTGDPDLPIVRTIHRRRLGEVARRPPATGS